MAALSHTPSLFGRERERDTRMDRGRHPYAARPFGLLASQVFVPISTFPYLAFFSTLLLTTLVRAIPFVSFFVLFLFIRTHEILLEAPIVDAIPRQTCIMFNPNSSCNVDHYYRDVDQWL